MPDNAALINLKESIAREELVVVVGTGVSVSLTNNEVKQLSWTGLIESGFAFAGIKGKITPAQIETWKSQLQSDDIDEVLSAAEFVGRKLGAPSGDLYARWLNESFTGVVPKNTSMIDAIKSIADLGVPLCTLNYDSLLESVTGLSTIVLSDNRKATAWMRREELGVLHLHGHWQAPDSCVLGIRDYEGTLNDETRDLFQRHLGAFKRLLFVGCGDTFSDPNFSALIIWLRSQMGASTLQHYALVSEQQYAGRHADPAWLGFVDPLSFGPKYSDLPCFLKKLFTGESKTVQSTTKIKKAASVDRSSKLLESYREFLVRDCGQMTIEGVRADMDTAQRRFDLERLFVPLELLPCMPDVSLDDPSRQVKMTHWKKKKKEEPKSFGEIFHKTKGLALLALPGGGKSLLLKRLAVAYASPDRRSKSDDNLPDIDVMPVLIRCREWRDHIKLPIATLLKSLPDITGQPDLVGLNTALIALFKKGKVLLLVDGLDEIHDDADRTIFVEHLRAFLDQYPKTKLVVTSREAGFNLVAPYLASYCEQWRVAPLSSEAIQLLCGHWHKLMVGNSPEALEEASSVSKMITSSDALRRLAENPLLLTMLLVVKHGAGRLPPDRVSLYSRAVEVLLDTWNIKGHDALNSKEAIPQLSYIAYELMTEGKQTATEKELVQILERARESVPQIKRYAKDTPYEFLRRVELRSSLLLEAGHQVENGRAVPFYQFRHLTFQEYLTALAIVDGNYDGYDAKAPIIKPIRARLLSDEWKEVVPMTAVLAGKRADSVIKELVHKGALLKKKFDDGKSFAGKREWLFFPNVLPAPIARLVQSLIEEAEAAPKTLTEALRLVSYFAKGCRSTVDWKALCRGPYGGELLHQAWLLYESFDTPADAWVRNSYACFANFRKRRSYWFTVEGQSEINELLLSDSDEEVCLGLMTAVGVLWNGGVRRVNSNMLDEQMASRLQVLLFSDKKTIAHVALWTWSLNLHYAEPMPTVPEEILNFLLAGYLGLDLSVEHSLYSFALHGCMGTRRESWKPVLNQAQITHIRNVPEPEGLDGRNQNSSAAVLIAFHAGNIWSDAEMVAKIVVLREFCVKYAAKKDCDRLDKMLSQISPFGTDYLMRVAEQDALEGEPTMDEFDEEDLESFEELSDNAVVTE
jgi:hypothetical protein